MAIKQNGCPHGFMWRKVPLLDQRVDCWLFLSPERRHKAKGLNTYVYYICLISMFDEKYNGLRIIVSDSAMRELMKEEKTLCDVVEILEQGYCAPRKRKQGTMRNADAFL